MDVEKEGAPTSSTTSKASLNDLGWWLLLHISVGDLRVPIRFKRR